MIVRNALERLRALVDVADPDGTVTVAWLAQLLEQDGLPGAEPDVAGIPADYTVKQLAERFGKSEKTIHDWISKGLDSYILGNERRVTPEALEAWVARHREGKRATRRTARPQLRAKGDLKAWRKHMPKGTTNGGAP